MAGKSSTQLMVNWWFGARWFGFLVSPEATKTPINRWLISPKQTRKTTEKNSHLPEHVDEKGDGQTQHLHEPNCAAGSPSHPELYR